MTTATLSRLPLSAGGAVAGSLARGGYWALARLIDLCALAANQFMRAPVAISVIAAIAGLSILAGSNALYFQTSRHPAPLFFAPVKQAAPAVKPVIPATRPRPLQQSEVIDNETTGSLGNAPATDLIGNDAVLALQKKLAALNFFDGTADGLFGRRTASAIKAFETKSGRRPRGLLTRELIAAVMATPIPDMPPLPAAAAVAATNPAPLARPVATAAPAGTPVAMVMPLAKPVPLVPLPQAAAATPQSVAAPAAAPANTFDANALPAAQPAPVQIAEVQPQAIRQPSRRAPSPDDVLDAAGDTAAGAFDTVASAIADVADTRGGLPQRPAPAANLLPSLAQAASPVPSAVLAVPAGADTTVVAMNSPPAKPAPAAAMPVTDGMSPAQRLAAQMGTLPPATTVASAAAPAVVSNVDDSTASVDPVLITKIQRGLASLGFLGAKIDGVPGEGTAKAIRNFEVFYDYKVTGQASPQLLNLLIQHGAVI